MMYEVHEFSTRKIYSYLCLRWCHTSQELAIRYFLTKNPGKAIYDFLFSAFKIKVRRDGFRFEKASANPS
jgi:hypothetical protein